MLRLLSLLIGTCLAFGLAEIGLRVTGTSPARLITKRKLRSPQNPLLTYQCYTDNHSGDLGPIPDVSHGEWELFDIMDPPTQIPLDRLPETPFCVEYRRTLTRTGNRLRGPRPTLQPQPGVRRILGIGDSFAFGEGVPAERSLFSQIQGLLGGKVEVVNGGRSGADTDTEIKILYELAAEYHSDRALFIYIPNDIRLTPALASRQAFINDLINVRDQNLDAYEKKAWYTGHSRVLHFLGGGLAMNNIAQTTIKWYLDSYDPAHNQENLDALRENIRDLASVPGRQVAFVIYPLMDGLERGYPLAPIHTWVANTARAAGLPVLDLAPYFRGLRSRTMWVHPSDHHPNGKAHAIAARAIVSWLQREVPGFL